MILVVTRHAKSVILPCAVNRGTTMSCILLCIGVHDSFAVRSAFHLLFWSGRGHWISQLSLVHRFRKNEHFNHASPDLGPVVESAKLSVRGLRACSLSRRAVNCDKVRNAERHSSLRKHLNFSPNCCLNLRILRQSHGLPAIKKMHTECV